MNTFKVGDRVRVLLSKFGAGNDIPGEWTILEIYHGHWYDLGHHAGDFMRWNVVGWRLEVVSGS